jgi:hypothetical protein
MVGLRLPYRRCGSKVASTARCCDGRKHNDSVVVGVPLSLLRANVTATPG